jgi:3'-phosphoadenosine 5'-phosphosulfate (PAPS) 3'-phosphatase
VLSPTDIASRRMCVDWNMSFRGSALKFGMVAEGAADVYLRSGSLMHWDIAAGDALVQAAGGACTTHGGKPIRYIPESPFMPPFVARSSAMLIHPLIVPSVSHPSL